MTVPRPTVSKEEYDTPRFWENYLNRVHEVLPTREQRDQVRGILLYDYECGNYEVALEKLEDALNVLPESIEVTWPFIKFCKHVLSLPIDRADLENRRAHEKWLAWRTLLPDWLFGRLFKARPPYMRCKYCARFVSFIDPDYGFAYLGVNHCIRCDRSYPMPSVQWDSVGGQAYMFYRRSVTEEAFYLDFVRAFDVKNYNDETFGGSKAPGL